ncbi:MAG: ATP-binding protein [Chloroflexi bacterium]|nr:ATP-binding protein [Chloroflexota bacterium]
MSAPFANPHEFISASLARTDLLLQRQVMRLRAARTLNESSLRGLYIADELVDALLNRVPADDVRDGAQGLTQAIAQATQEIAQRSAAAAPAEALPHQRLTRLFGLSTFECELLLLAAAPDMHLRYQTVFAYVQNDISQTHLTVDLALNLLCESFEESLIRRDVFADDAPLLRHGLLRLFDDAQDREPPLLARRMKVDARIVAYLLGDEALDTRLAAFARVDDSNAPAPGDLELASHARAAVEAWAALPHAWREREHLVWLISGPHGAGKHTLAHALCGAWHMPMLSADLARALRAPCGLRTALDLLVRECALRGAALCLERLDALLADDANRADRLDAVQDALAQQALPTFITSEHAWRPRHAWRGSRWHELALELPALDARLRLWQRALATHAVETAAPDGLAEIAGKFALTPGQIHDAARALAGCQTAHPVGAAELHGAALAQSNPTLGALAQKIEPRFGWEDIVLPAQALAQLREVLAAARARFTVYGQWGFARKVSRSKGANILFSGPSGTGKTMAAQIIARELRLDLYRIDLATLVSKYIGETEKNLSRIFAEAQTSNAILFFDEADALFGKRGEVKDSHDRYANIEVAYLLQRMEEYEGMAILATNLGENIDEAFKRRMHHTVEFPFPDSERRERIWRSIFPAEAPLALDTDFGFLARQFELSGGNIRNAALLAAFLAADEGSTHGTAGRTQIAMRHLILATAREMQKIGKLPARAEFRQYYELLRES